MPEGGKALPRIAARRIEPMSIVRAHVMVSADGFMAGDNFSAQKPFGDIPPEFLSWMFKLKSFQELGMGSGGETGPTDDVIRETQENLGATIMGRRMFAPGDGEWDLSWKGWWGDNPPYHTDVYVLSHHPREPLPMEGGTTFYFVTDGIESAMQRARQSAGDRDIRIGGGADTVNQYLAAGLVDELETHVVPVLIGSGRRLFEGVGPDLKLEPVRTVKGSLVTHIKYRVLK
jgi:dihydrofolate reductase